MGRSRGRHVQGPGPRRKEKRGPDRGRHQPMCSRRGNMSLSVHQGMARVRAPPCGRGLQPWPRHWPPPLGHAVALGGRRCCFWGAGEWAAAAYMTTADDDRGTTAASQATLPSSRACQRECESVWLVTALGVQQRRGWPALPRRTVRRGQHLTIQLPSCPTAFGQHSAAARGSGRGAQSAGWLWTAWCLLTAGRFERNRLNH
jgi:hypothetical protein